MNKKWLIIIGIVAFILILAAIPLGIVLSIHNSSYDCSFNYVKVDDMLNEIARKHTYYSANDKTAEIWLDQDMINSLIKDNLSSIEEDLPDKFTISEVLFNTKDQRIYINAKYGKLNTPISAKVNINILAEGVEVSADDIRIGKMKAPGFVKKQIPQDSLKYSINFKDLDVPMVFSVKDIKFGSGIVKAYIQLDAEKVADLAADYRGDVMKQIDTIKSGQSPYVSIFIDKLLGTGIMSRDKIREYVIQALDDEELVNSAIYFATADDLSRYSKKLDDIQKKVTDWAAPLQKIKYYGSIDETVDNILYDQEIRDLLAWFLPPEDINNYAATAEDYYGMYKDYYGMYEDALASLDKAVGGIDTKKINEYTDMVLDYMAQAEDARKLLRDQIAQVDSSSIKEFVYYFESDEDTAEEYISMLEDAKYELEGFTHKTYTKEISEFNSALDGQRKYALSIVRELKRKEYEQTVDQIMSKGVVDRNMKKFMDKYSKEIDVDELQAYIEDLK